MFHNLSLMETKEIAQTSYRVEATANLSVTQAIRYLELQNAMMDN